MLAVMANAGSISIIVPCWRDASVAIERARKWAAHGSMREIVLAGVRGFEPPIMPDDGEKINWCASAKASRGEQMNRGAELATGDALLFHHVDSELTAPHLDAILRALQQPEIIGGGFYRAFDERHPALRRLEKLERIHNRIFGTIYGDQSVFVRREIFQRLGGFAPIPLMEDVEFGKRLRRAGKITLLDPPMRSSPRRQMEQGAWRVTWRNLFFLIAFRCGVSAHALHRYYYRSEQPLSRAQRIPSENPVTE
jgi:hypothetical protein